MIKLVTKSEAQKALQFGTFIGTLDNGGSSVYRYNDYEYIITSNALESNDARFNGNPKDEPQPPEVRSVATE